MNKNAVSSADIAKFITILGKATKLNLKNPRELAQAKSIMNIAKKLQPRATELKPGTNEPKYPGLRQAIEGFMNGPGATPAVGGVKDVTLEAPKLEAPPTAVPEASPGQTESLDELNELNEQATPGAAPAPAAPTPPMTKKPAIPQITAPFPVKQKQQPPPLPVKQPPVKASVAENKWESKTSAKKSYKWKR